MTLRPQHLIKLSREFRQRQTHTEKLMWNALRLHKQSGLKFRREHPIIGYIADFYCAEFKLIVEIDGGVHSEKEVVEHDKKRQQHLEAAGFCIIRFTSNEVMIDIDGVISKILVACGKERLRTGLESGKGAGTLSPNPSPKALGEGDFETVWENNEWKSLPILTNDIRTQICVVGLGGSGLSCITELLARGFDVVGIDAGSVAGGAAGKNGGFLLAGLAQFHHQAIKKLGRENAVAFYKRTIDEIKRMASETPEAVRLTGSLRIAFNDEEYDDIKEQYYAMRSDKLPVEFYEGAEGKGILIPTDGVFNPLLRSRILASRAIQRDAKLFEQTRAIKIEPRTVYTTNGVIHCDQIVVAVDGKLGKIFPSLAPRLKDVRLQMLATAPTDEVHLSRPVYTRWGYDYWQQLPDGRIAMGGCRDIGGDEEYTSDPTPSDDVQNALTKIIRDKLKVSVPITQRWAAIVSYTENGVPICEEIQPGIWAIGGYSGTGNVVGALLGREVASKLAFAKTK